MALRPITLDRMLIGERLPWDLYTGDGVLVARAGTEVVNAAHFGQLSRRPLFRKHLEAYSLADDGRDPTAELRHLMHALPGTLIADGSPLFEQGIRQNARTLIRFSHLNHDALLGLARLMPMEHPAARHSLLVGIVAIALGRHLDWHDRNIETVVCAALTMNMSALRLHAELASGARPYDDLAARAIREHPERSARLLESCGVTDPEWLAAVRQHHENLDGTGYPLGLSGGQISEAARLLRVSDYYMAKLSGRNGRPPKSARFALNLILRDRDSERLDAQVAQRLLHRYGLYPVGSLVRLKNHEIAMVTRNSGRCGNASVAMSFIREHGRLLAFPIERNLAEPDYAVVRVLERDLHRSKLPWELFWRDWS